VISSRRVHALFLLTVFIHISISLFTLFQYHFSRSYHVSYLSHVQHFHPTRTKHRSDYLRVVPPSLRRLMMFDLVPPLSPSGHRFHDVVGDLPAGPHHLHSHQSLDANEMPYCGTRSAAVIHALDSRTRERFQMMCQVPDSELSLDSPWTAPALGARIPMVKVTCHRWSQD